MKQVKVDRRIQRTRRLLGDALLALIEEKGYGAITVQDILDRADLGRSTFYAHYRDKEDLLVGTFENFKVMFEEDESQLSADGRRLRPEERSTTLDFFRHTGGHHRLYKALVGKSGGEVVRKLLYQYVAGLMKIHLEQLIPNDENMAAPRAPAVHFYISSFLALLTWWLDNDMPYTAERMDQIFNTLTLPGFNSALGIRPPLNSGGAAVAQARDHHAKRQA
jgi:AcrR family transcriptional regulator